MRKLILFLAIVLIVPFCLCSCDGLVTMNHSVEKDVEESQTSNEKTKTTSKKPETTATSTTKKNAKKVLVDYVVKNGKQQDGEYYLLFQETRLSEYYSYFVIYDTSVDKIAFELYKTDFELTRLPTSDDIINMSVTINHKTDVVWCYYQTSNGASYEGFGVVEKTEFGKNSSDTLTGLYVSGDDSAMYEMVEILFSTTTRLLLSRVSLEMKNWDIGITLKDLGYINY